MALEYFKTQVLLLHSQQSTLDSLSSGFNDRYAVHCATTGSEALSTLGVTPIHVIVSAQDLPGMSGLDALREAKKRSPETIGILLAGRDQSDGLEALVGEKEVFQIVRGDVTPESLRSLIDAATKQARLIALSESANDTAANVDEPMGEHIVMETSENGSAIISDGTGTMPALKPQKIQIGAEVGSRGVDILVLTKDEEFLATIKDSARGLHKVHHAITPSQAEGFFKENKIGILVTDAAMVGSNIEVLTQRLRIFVPRLVAIVAGRRDDGELLMDLINRGQVYRFLLKPVSPGRARLAIEASIKHHLEAADGAFKPVAGKPAGAAAAKLAAPPARPPQNAPAKPRQATPAKPPAKPVAATKPVRKAPTISGSPISDGLDDAFGDDSSFTETMTGIATSIGKSLTGGSRKAAEAVTKSARVEKTADSGGTSAFLRSPKVIAATAGLLLLLVAGLWLFSGPDAIDSPPEAVDAKPAMPEDESVPRVVESGLPAPSTSAVEAIAEPAYTALLDEARIARNAGEVIAPAGSSAVELYIAARDAAPDDIVIANELADLVDQVLGMAEAALLAQKTKEADAAINMVRLATPENPRLAFLDAQLAQLKFRSALDEARSALREKRFEDAAKQLAIAKLVRGVDQTEVRLLTEELAGAKSEQRIDEVLALAASRLESDNLTSPSNDNARYYYELALGNDPKNTAAQQGLIIVAGKLVLKARSAIDSGQLDQAGILLRDASALDPDSSELAASAAALQNARQAQADAERQTELERQAAAERKAAAERQADAERKAAAERLAEAERKAAATAAAGGSAKAAPSGAGPAGSASANSAVPGASQAGLQREPAAANPAGTAEASLAAAARRVTQQDGESVAQETPATASAEPQAPEMVGITTLNRTRYVSPKYPRSAMRRGITGYVDVRMTIARDGSVYDIEVLDAKPETVFNEAALEAVQQWQFEPVLEGNVPVEKRTAVRMAFELQ